MTVGVIFRGVDTNRFKKLTSITRGATSDMLSHLFGESYTSPDILMLLDGAAQTIKSQPKLAKMDYASGAVIKQLVAQRLQSTAARQRDQSRRTRRGYDRSMFTI